MFVLFYLQVIVGGRCNTKKKSISDVLYKFNNNNILLPGNCFTAK